jgi:hypothetical protein
MNYKKKGYHELHILAETSSVTCVLCCSKEPSCQPHTRFGYKTKASCTTCLVHLCSKKRWTADYGLVDTNWPENPQKASATLTCFEVYHQADVLPNLHSKTCLMEGTPHNENEPLSRPAKAPRRGAQSASDATAEDAPPAVAGAPRLGGGVKRPRSASITLPMFERRFSARHSIPHWWSCFTFSDWFIDSNSIWKYMWVNTCAKHIEMALVKS